MQIIITNFTLSDFKKLRYTLINYRLFMHAVRFRGNYWKISRSPNSWREYAVRNEKCTVVNGTSRPILAQQIWNKINLISCKTSNRMNAVNETQWLTYLTKCIGSLFSIETATWLEICIRVYQLPETLRVHTHNTSFFKVPCHKGVKQKKMT